MFHQVVVPDPVAWNSALHVHFPPILDSQKGTRVLTHVKSRYISATLDRHRFTWTQIFYNILLMTCTTFWEPASRMHRYVCEGCGMISCDPLNPLNPVTCPWGGGSTSDLPCRCVWYQWPASKEHWTFVLSVKLRQTAQVVVWCSCVTATSWRSSVMWDRASADAGGAGIPHVEMTLTPGGPKFPSTAREQDAPSIQMMCFPSRPVTYSFNHFRLPGEICGLKVLEAI